MFDESSCPGFNLATSRVYKLLLLQELLFDELKTSNVLAVGGLFLTASLGELLFWELKTSNVLKLEVLFLVTLGEVTREVGSS